MDWVPGRTWGWLGPSGSLCNELFIHSLDFVVLRVAPASWLTQLAPDHPFLRVHGDRLAAHCVPPSLPGG
jgi:hypothetical protein